jgi:hypothetical protein
MARSLVSPLFVALFLLLVPSADLAALGARFFAGADRGFLFLRMYELTGIFASCNAFTKNVKDSQWRCADGSRCILPSIPQERRERALALMQAVGRGRFRSKYPRDTGPVAERLAAACQWTHAAALKCRLVQ